MLQLDDAFRRGRHSQYAKWNLNEIAKSINRMKEHALRLPQMFAIKFWIWGHSTKLGLIRLILPDSAPFKLNQPRRPQHLLFACYTLAYMLQCSDCILQFDDAFQRARHPQYTEWISNKIAKAINKITTGWKSMLYGLCIYFAWNPRLKSMNPPTRIERTPIASSKLAFTVKKTCLNLALLVAYLLNLSILLGFQVCFA